MNKFVDDIMTTILARRRNGRTRLEAEIIDDLEFWTDHFNIAKHFTDAPYVVELEDIKRAYIGGASPLEIHYRITSWESRYMDTAHEYKKEVRHPGFGLDGHIFK
jgi:hypothetical protein